MVYMVTYTINIPPMLAYIPYMDPMGYVIKIIKGFIWRIIPLRKWLMTLHSIHSKSGPDFMGYPIYKWDMT